KRIDEAVVRPRGQQILPVFLLRLREIEKREWQPRIARRQIERQLLERLGGIVPAMRLVLRHCGLEELVRVGVDLRIEWGLARQRCREQQSQQYWSELEHPNDFTLGGRACSRGWASDRMVSHAQLPHLLDVVKISAIDDDRLPESALHPPEIGVAVLVPVSDHDQGVRTSERLIISLSVIYSVAEQNPRMSQSRGVVGAD